jgi:molybdenum cofactor cytidylyltransferase
VPPFLIVGIVLAAGESSRMGQPKALLPFGPGGDTFVTRSIRVLCNGGVSDVRVVGRPTDAVLRGVTATLGDMVRYVENPQPERGQLSSLIAGIDAAPAADAVIVLPVDIPQVRAETVAAVIAAATASRAPILRATHHGRHGHPVLFRRIVFDDLRHADPGLGAKAVLQKYATELVDVEVDDPGILHDVDRPEDYVTLFGIAPPK